MYHTKYKKVYIIKGGSLYAGDVNVPAALPCKVNKFEAPSIKENIDMNSQKYVSSLGDNII